MDSIYIEGNVIKLSFCVNSKQLIKKFKKKSGEVETEHYLLDEIYERCLKTFLETLYSNRFFAPNNRYTKITVNVYLLDEYEDYLIDPISFILEESGYPFISHGDIFQMCKKDLKDTAGANIDGEYIAQLIEKKTAIHEKSI